MENLMDVLGLGASVASGGLFGLFGSLVGAGTKYLQERQRQAWEEKKWAYETQLLKLEMEARAIETEHELALASQQGAWKGLEVSHSTEAGIKQVDGWVNNLRALFRPVLTLCLWLVATAFFIAILAGGLSTWMDAIQLAELVSYMVLTVFFSASTATVWWFGDRALMPPGVKNR